jgi:hypothetical protein
MNIDMNELKFFSMNQKNRNKCGEAEEGCAQIVTYII